VQSRKRSPGTGLRLAAAGFLLLVLAALLCVGPSVTRTRTAASLVAAATPLPTAVPPTVTPEPIVPSRTPTNTPEPTHPVSVMVASPTSIATKPPVSPIRTPESSVIETPTSAPTTAPTSTSTIMPTSTPTIMPTPPPTSPAWPWQGRPRWGIGVVAGSIADYNVEPLRLGWYLDWGAQLTPPRPGGAVYAQMVRCKDSMLDPPREALAAIAQANPGSLWLIGNEPDVKWQDNIGAATYARLYHEAYTTIKAADPTAQIAIGGITQPTPLRLRYLDAVLTAYQDQFGTAAPMDVWHIHNFILREERGGWGVDIPPGFPDETGMLYEIDDNDDIDIFRQQILGFRQWMLDRGYRNYPLVISEYGIPMPEDYGFPPERVIGFLENTFGFFLTATDGELGYPEDGNRLVQLWCWYSLNDSDSYYPQGRLIDPVTGQMTAVGRGWAAYVAER
jgi:hypothetical protein